MSKNDLPLLAQALRHRAIEVPTLPGGIFIEVVFGCPHSCMMCEANRERIEQFPASLVERLDPYLDNFEYIALVGFGEPLLSNKLDYFTKRCAQNNTVIHTITTAIRLTEELIDTLLQAKVSICISMHAATKKTYQRIMNASFELAQKNIQALINRNTEIGFPDNEFYLSLIVMKENINEIPTFLHLAKKLKVSKVRFQTLSPNFRTLLGKPRKHDGFIFRHLEQSNQNIKNQFLEDLPKIQNLAEQLGIEIRGGSMEHAAREITQYHDGSAILNMGLQKIIGKPVLPLIKRKGFCAAPWLGELCVRADGNVVLCGTSIDIVGNLYKQPLEEVWNSERMQQIRRDFSNGVFPRACGNCRGVTSANYPSNAFSGLH